MWSGLQADHHRTAERTGGVAGLAPQVRIQGASAESRAVEGPIDVLELSSGGQAMLDAQDRGVGLPAVGGRSFMVGSSTGGDKRRRRAVSDALFSGQPVAFSNSQGKRFDITVVPQGPTGDGMQSFKVQANGHELEVCVGARSKPDVAIAGVLNLWSQQPEHLQGDLRQVRFFDHKDPVGDKGFSARAQGGDGRIEFFNGTANLNKGVFDHEMGHCIADAVEDRQAGAEERAREQAAGYEVGESMDEQYTPEGYAYAVLGDKRSVSSYGNRSITEDWAEFWKAFMDAQSKGSRALVSLQKKFPNRYEMALAIYENRYDRQAV